jgi:chromosome segregation ATPase
MDKLALGLAILSLIVGSAAYWRSGGKQDVAAVSQEIEQQIQKLRAKQAELLENASAVTQVAYENMQQRLQGLGERLSELRKETSESLRRQADRARKQVEEIEQSVADGLQSMKKTSVEAARKTEEALAVRVRRIEARVGALEAKYYANRALAKAEAKDFDKADEYLQKAVFLFNQARYSLDDDHAYDAKFDEVAESLRKSIAAVKAQAADLQARIEKVTTETDELVAALEADEQAAEIVAR